MIGQRLDKYEIVSKLGAGAMGAVYEAGHITTGRRVAIKVISGALDESLVARFKREARAAGAIDSIHIAQVLDAGKDGDSPFLVMELLKGQDVDAFMKANAPLRPMLALRIVAQALAGLERAHAANVIHRDIKPANLFLAESDGEQLVVKVVDFGIAKMKDDLSGSREYHLTQTASLLGSPLFMSPEQARTSKNVDARADLWSLGVVLYSMLTGQPPHFNAQSLTELLLAICTEPAKPVQDVAPWVPPQVAAIATKALELDINKRYASATEMLAAIAAVLPDWQRLNTHMLSGMSTEERKFAAPRLTPVLDRTEVTPNAVLGSSSNSSTNPNANTNETSKPGVTAVSAPGFAASVPDSPGGTAAKSGRVLPLVAGVGVIGIVAAAFFGFSSKSKTPAVAAPTGLVPAVVSTATQVAASSSSAPVESAPSIVVATEAPSASPSVVVVAKVQPKLPVVPSATAAQTTAPAAPSSPPAPKPKPSAAPAAPSSSSSIARDFN